VHLGPVRSGVQARAGARLGWVLILPALLVLAGITVFPLVYNVWNSVHRVAPIEGPDQPFVGAANFRRLVIENSFLPALGNTLVYAFISVSLELMLGLAIALLLNRRFAGRGMLRAGLLIPWAVPSVVAATLWKSMFDQRNGFVDYLLGAAHLPGAHTTWLAGATTSWIAILVADAWQSTPLVVILLLAGLQSIPTELYEAATVDGASAWHSLWRLTLPLLRPAIMVVVVFRTLSAMLIFDVIYVMTGGGPGSSTETLSFVDYRAFLVDSDFGYGGAISLSMVAASVLVALALRRALSLRD
jgi:ABC-type sugar transport system permease subunit